MRKFLLLLSTFAYFQAKSQVDIDLKLDVIPAFQLKPSISAEVGMGKLGLDLTISKGGLSIATEPIQKSVSKPKVIDISGNEILPGQDNVSEIKSIKGYGICISPFWYFRPKYSLDGFRFGPYVSYQIGQNDVYKGRRMSVGASLGSKRFFTERIGIEYSIGGGKAILTERTDKITGVKSSVGDKIPEFKFMEKFAGMDLFISLKGIYRFGEGFQF